MLPSPPTGVRVGVGLEVGVGVATATSTVGKAAMPEGWAPSESE